MLTAKGVQIFVVHGDPSTASRLTTALLGKGYAARYFVDSHEAIVAARAHAPEVLIAAVSLADMSGIELATLVQRLRPACGVILTVEPALMRQVEDDCGGQDHGFAVLNEPVSTAELLAKVDSVCRRFRPFLVRS